MPSGRTIWPLRSSVEDSKELADDLETWKVELEKRIGCVATHDKKMIEQADQEAHLQNLWDRIFRSTAAPVAATVLARAGTTAGAPAIISTPTLAVVLSTVAVMTAIDDGDGDLIRCPPTQGGRVG